MESGGEPLPLKEEGRASKQREAARSRNFFQAVAPQVSDALLRPFFFSLSLSSLSFPLSHTHTKLNPPSLPPHPTHPTADCGALVTSLARGPCAVLKPVLHGQYGQPSAYASADCSQLTGEVERLGLTLSDVCCTDARAFVDTGCACSPDVQDLLVGLRVLPAGADPVATINGIVGLLQGSRCSGAAFGGPIMNPCVGSAGCPLAA